VKYSFAMYYGPTSHNVSILRHGCTTNHVGSVRDAKGMRDDVSSIREFRIIKGIQC
jgi:hypothetical protein